MYKSPSSATNGRTQPSSGSRQSLGCDQCRFYNGIARSKQKRLYYGCCRFCDETFSFRRHSHNHFRSRFRQVVRQTCHHGLPQKFLSDRGPQFVAEFTWELYRLLGIKLAATMAYHPQGDGQTEGVNQELEQYLRVFINQRQDDWDGLLPFAEFQYTNHIHSATRQIPFLLDT